LLTELGFKEVPQKPCVMLKNGIVVFFYVNDIVFCYRKTNEKKAQKAIKKLNKEYQISILGKLKWFLGIHVLCNCRQRLLWLSQEAYIKKITNQYEIDLNRRLPDTPIAETELLPTNHQLIHPTLPVTDLINGLVDLLSLETRAVWDAWQDGIKPIKP